MFSQKTSAWYRHVPWYRQPIVPALMPCSSGAWRFRLVPNNARHKNKEARNYAGFRAFYAIRCQPLPDAGSFPLDGGRRLAGNIVGDPGDTADFIDDPVGHLLQELVGQMRPASGHEVDGFHCTQGDHPFVATGIANHAHRLDRQEHGKGLTGLVIQVGLAQLLDEDVVGVAQDVGVLLAYLGEDAHTQPRTREGVTVDHVIGQAQFQTYLAYLVLEQFAQRLDQFEGHVFGQTTDVVVGLDHMGLAVLGGGRLDHVGVDGALGKELDALEFGGFLIEYLDEGTADDLALGLRIGHAQQAGQEFVLGIGADHLDAHVLGEHGHDLVPFVQTQQAVVDEYAGQLITDGLVQQRGNHRGVHTAGQAQQYLGIADLGANPGNGVLDDMRRRPECLTGADFQQEARQDAQALLGVGHFRMELHAVETTVLVGHGGNGTARRAGDHLEALGERDHLVAVAHPYIQGQYTVIGHRVLDAVEEGALADQIHAGIAELTDIAALDPAAQLGSHGLHAVADTQHGHAQLEHQLGRPGAALGGDRLGAAGENDALGREGADGLGLHVPGMNLAVDAYLPHPPGNQLGVLGTEIQNQDAVCVNIMLSHGMPSRAGY